MPDVAWADDSAAIVVLTRDDADRDVVAVVERERVEVEPSHDLAGMPLGTVVAENVPVELAAIADPAEFRRYADVLRCAAMAGLQKRLYDMTSAYVSERHQFGKPVGSFQAVQVHTVALAQCASMSLVAVDRAANAVSLGGGEFEVRATGTVVGENAVRAAAAAHQAHGAIGMTREYPLQQVTRRLHCLRQLWSPHNEGAVLVGGIVLGSPSLSELVARHPEHAHDGASRLARSEVDTPSAG
jgi:acyl-CoA dehydrogenase